MTFLRRVPQPPLDAFVASIWYCEIEARPLSFERVLPTGAAQLIVNLQEDQTRMYHPEWGTPCTTSSGMVLSGVLSRYCVIDTAEQECVVGVTFHPGGTAPFFKLPAHETKDADISVANFWGRQRAAELREQLLAPSLDERGRPDPGRKLDVMEGALREQFRPPGPHPAVDFALRVFAHGSINPRVASVIEDIGLSPKRFIERFKSVVGLAPKQYCRILRFQRALADADKGIRIDWTRIAFDCGYFDQAHFIHDFRAFAGITPTDYREARTEFRNHVKFLQSPLLLP